MGVGTPRSFEESRTAGAKLEEHQRSSGKRTAPEQLEPASPQKLRMQHVMGAFQSPQRNADNDDDDPLAYLRNTVAAKKSAKSKKPPVPKQGSPLKKAKQARVQKVVKGSKKSTEPGVTSKQEQLSLENRNHFDGLAAGMSQILLSFEKGGMDKPFIQGLLTNCSAALAWYAKPSSFEVDKLEKLNVFKLQIDAMLKFTTATMKKSAKADEFNVAMSACEQAPADSTCPGWDRTCVLYRL